MRTWMRHTGVAVLAALLAAGAASAQGGRQQRIDNFLQRQGLTQAQANQMASVLAQLSRSQIQNGIQRVLTNRPNLLPGGLTPGLVGNPYSAYANPYTAGYGSGGYSTSYGSNPYGETEIGGFLRGTADVVNSTGNFLIQQKQANLLSEQVNKERIENRKRLFDQWLYEREKGPTWEEERQRTLKQWTARSLNDPPTGEIWSGTALNFILADIQKKAAKDKSTRGPDVSLDEDVLRRVNLSPRPDNNAGLLKNEGRLDWPLALRSDEFKADRRLLTELVPEAIRQAVNGRVDAGTLKDIMAAADRIRAGLRGQVGDLPPGQYMAAARFLNDFADALRVLQQPDAGDYLTQKYAAKGKSVSELVRYMTERGLRFAPAVAGEESAYVAMHRALAAYDAGITTTLAADRQQPMP